MKPKALSLTALYLALCSVMLFSVVGLVFVSFKPETMGFENGDLLGRIIVSILLLVLVFMILWLPADAARVASDRARRAARIKIGDTAILGHSWRYDSHKKKYVPYEFFTVTVKNPRMRENFEGGVVRSDGKRFEFGDKGVVPMGERVRAIAFPDRKHVLVEYGTDREYQRDDEVPAGTWFKLTREEFITTTDEHYATVARLRQEQEQREVEELDRLTTAEQEALAITRSIGQGS